jgi:hypothetical protein
VTEQHVKRSWDKAEQLHNGKVLWLSNADAGIPCVHGACLHIREVAAHTLSKISAVAATPKASFHSYMHAVALHFMPVCAKAYQKATKARRQQRLTRRQQIQER